MNYVPSHPKELCTELMHLSFGLDRSEWMLGKGSLCYVLVANEVQCFYYGELQSMDAIYLTGQCGRIAVKEWLQPQWTALKLIA